MRKINWLLIPFSVFIWVTMALLVRAYADEPKMPPCPNPGERCKILFLTEPEERMLMGPNGILDTAAQARSLDLGQFSVYLKTRIAGALQGEFKPAAPVETK